MPNHIHGLIQNAGADLQVCPNDDPDEYAEHAQGEHPGSPLPRVLQWFKTMTTNAHIHGVKQHDWPPFHGGLWQRSYYERIIRNDGESNRIREYLINDPAEWKMDRENPNGTPPVAANVRADLRVCPNPESPQEHP
ncbi:MAG: transposase [Candidatus Latescibacterota bacterium]